MWTFSSAFEHTTSVCDGGCERVKVRVWCQWLMSPGQAAGGLQVTSWYPPSLIIHPFLVPKCHIKPIQHSLRMCVCVCFFLKSRFVFHSFFPFHSSRSALCTTGCFPFLSLLLPALIFNHAMSQIWGLWDLHCSHMMETEGLFFAIFF